ncbi:MAG: heme o synthase [Anaerolineales bacterium]|nr:heme o synthase [Anaerolineales bacterium]
MENIRKKFRSYWTLIKSLQTALLLITGLAGFMSSRCPWLNLSTTLSVAGSLFLAISGSTVLNMWYDRDIDAKMDRTRKRPLSSGDVPPGEALILGLVLSVLGVGWALSMDLLYGAIVFAGLFFDVVIYTIWLKRRTAWSIVWGGLAGGMPVLAGRALGVGYIDWVGIMLALAVLFWIPTHILTFSLRYREDYERAGIPTFPSTYGADTTRRVIALSSVLASIAMALGALGAGMTVGYMRLIIVLSAGLLALAVGTFIRPSDRLNFGLFKYASLYMLSIMLLLAAEVFK